MQSYNYQNNQIHIAGPASSKALTKLKNDRFIQSHPINYQNVQTGTIPNYLTQNNKPHISFKTHQPIYHNQQKINMQRQNSNDSKLSNSKINNLSKSQVSVSNVRNFVQPLHMSQVALQQQIQMNTGYNGTLNGNLNFNTTSYNNNLNIKNNVGGMNTWNCYNTNSNQSLSAIKPQSAFQYSNNPSTNFDASRVRSSSASQFSANQSQRRIIVLQTKISQYQKQLFQCTNTLNQKQRKLNQLENQLHKLRAKKIQSQLKLQQNHQKYLQSQDKIKQLQHLNQQYENKKQELNKNIQITQQKIKNLQSSHEKIIISKNIEIENLNQSCKELSKSLEMLQYKYEELEKNMDEKMRGQATILMGNQKYLESLQEKIRKYQQENNKIAQYEQHIRLLQYQNNIFKSQLQKIKNNLHLQFFQNTQKQHTQPQQKQQTQKLKQQLQTLNQTFQNCKKVGQQQIQYLQLKVQQGIIQKQKLMQQLQLSKVVTIKRNMVFQRQIIYQLKRQNDRLWKKLTQKQEENIANMQDNIQYWGNSEHKTLLKPPDIQNPNLNKLNNIPPKSPQPIKNYPPDIDLTQYKNFLSQLQKTQHKSPNNNFSPKLSKQDYNFYKNKCTDLQRIVQQHLQINNSLKKQLQKIQKNSNNYNILNVEIGFLKNQLQQQRVLNQTLKRSFQLFKNQYQLKFRAAQNKVQQIQAQNKISSINYSYQSKSKAITFQSVQLLSLQLSNLQQKIRQLTLQNSNLNIKISQLNRYQSLYWQIKQKYDQMSPISVYRQYKQTDKNTQRQDQLQKQRDSLLKQLQNIKKQKSVQQAKKIQLQLRHKCQTLETQLRMKDNQFQLLFKDLQKIQSQFYTSKIHHNNLLADIANLQSQLAEYKQGKQHKKDRKSIDKHQIAINISLLKQRLIQIQTNLKQLNKIYMITKNYNIKQKQDNNIKQIEKVILSLEKGIAVSLVYCGEIQQSKIIKI